MPYVGNPLADAFSSREKQDLTGQSGTSFTLAHAVSSPNDLSVYINHVRQEPTTAYSVNGTTLTTTGSVASTDDFYIIYDELAVQSISHPTNQALTATSGTFTSGLVGTTATFSGAVSGTNGTFSGNVSGTLTTAAQPNITSVGTLTSLNTTSIGATTVANISFNSHGTYLGNYRSIGWGGTANGTTQIYSQYNTVADLILHAGTGKDIVFETGGSTADRLRLDSDGNLGLGINANFTSGTGFHLADNYKIGFGAGGNSRPDFQLGYASSDDRLHLACGYGADTGDIQWTTGGQQQFRMSGGNTALYFMDASNSNYAVCGFEPATYNGGINRWYTQNATDFAIAYGGINGFFMKHDTRQVTLSNNGQNYPGDGVRQLTIGYNLGGNKGGIYMPTYSYYNDVSFRIVNNDTNNGRQSDDILFERNGSRHGGIRIVGASGVSYSSISDYREKTDEKPIDDAIGTVKKLKPYNFKWKKSGIRQDGFFAHEVDEVLDYAVSGEKDATKTYEGVVLNKDGNMIASEVKQEDFDKRLIDGEDEEASPKGETTYPEGSTWKETYEDIEPQQMDPAKLVPILTAALQEAIKRIEVLESK